MFLHSNQGRGFPFEGDRETMIFTSEGGKLFSFVYKLHIVQMLFPLATMLPFMWWDILMVHSNYQLAVNLVVISSL